MNPVAVGACGTLLLATVFAVSTIHPTGTRVQFEDPAGQSAVAMCDRSFAPGNVDAPLTGRKHARALDDACQRGAALAHNQWKNPAEDPEVPIVVPDDVKDFRAGYREGLNKCLTKFNNTTQLQEQMSCMDGFDYFAATVVSNVSDYTNADPPDQLFDDQYFKDSSYIRVYQDVIDDRAWAYLLRDRVFNPEKYPGYRRDQLFAPNVPAGDQAAFEAKRREMMANQWNAAQAPPTSSSSSSGGTNTQTVIVHHDSNFWLWYWLYSHPNSYASSYAPVSSYNRDGGPRGAAAAYAGGGFSSGGVGPRPSADVYGPKAQAVQLSPRSPWSPARTSLSTNAQAKFGTPGNAIQRGGLGNYGGNAAVAEGAPRAGIAKASTFNSMSAARVGASMSSGYRGGGGSTGYGASSSRASSVSIGGGGRGSVGSGGGGGRGGGGGGGGHGGGSSGG